MVKKLLLALVLLAPSLAFATITHVGSAATPTAAGGSTPVVPAINASATTGDGLIIIAQVKGDNAGEAITTPTDYTLLHSVTQTGTGTHVTLYAFCKVHDNTEADPTVATTGTGTGDNVVAEIYVIRSSGGTFNCASIEAHANQSANAAATSLAHPALTVTTANTYILAFGAKPECQDCVFNTLATDSLGWTEATDANGTVGDDWSLVGDYVIQTTAASISAGSFTMTSGDESLISAAIVLSLQEAPTAATFSAGPAQVAVTTTTAQVSFTSSDTGTVEGVACANGSGTPTAAEILADQCSGGGAALAHFDEAVTAGVADGATFTPLIPSTTHDTFYVIDATVDSAVASLADQTTSAVAFTAGPTNTGCTTTTCSITFTTNIAGTVEGVACPDGQAAPSAVQVLADQCTGGIGAAAHFDEVVVLGVSDGEDFTGLTANTIYDSHYVIDGTGDSGVISLANITTQAVGGAIFVAASVSVTSAANGYDVAYTLDNQNATVYAVACAPGDAAPSQAELVAGQCGGGNAALFAANEAGVDGVPNSLPLTEANNPPKLDVYVGCDGASGDCTIETHADELRTARAGFAIVTLTSLSATSIFDCADCIQGGPADDYFEPDVAVGDVVEYENDADEDADCNVAFGADGDFVFTPVGAGDCVGRRSFNLSYEDVSSATDALFTAPAGLGTFAADDVVYNENSAPVCDNEDTQIAVLTVPAAMTTIDLDSDCTDADTDQPTYTADTTLPVGVSLNASTGALTGTPTEEIEAGVPITFTATDVAGDSDAIDYVFYPITTIAAPDLDSLTPAQAADAIVAAAPWRAADAGLTVGTAVCGSGQPFLTSAVQTPQAGTEITALQAFVINLVSATIPDLTGMTLAEAIAAIEAICP